jgi:hypothetical protein
MPTTAEISAKANDERERCRSWLRKSMENGQPKMATKEELWSLTKAELRVSCSSSDFGWGMAILDTGRERLVRTAWKASAEESAVNLNLGILNPSNA